MQLIYLLLSGYLITSTYATEINDKFDQEKTLLAFVKKERVDTLVNHNYQQVYDLNEYRSEKAAFAQNLKRSWISQIYDMKFFVGHHDGPANLILVTGVSSAGKSSVTQLVQRINPYCILYERDQFWINETINFLLKKTKGTFNNLYKTIGLNLLHCIYYHDNDPLVQRLVNKYSALPNFKQYLKDIKELFFLNRDNLYKAVNYKIADKVETALFLKKRVLVDITLTHNSIAPFFRFYPKIVLLYCPFEKLCQNVMSRNITANLENNLLLGRPLLRVIEQFTSIFRSKTKEDKISGLENLKRSVFIMKVEEALNTNSYRPTEFVSNKLLKNNLLEKLGFDQQEEIEIYLRNHKPNYIINVGNLSPEALAYKFEKLSHILL